MATLTLDPGTLEARTRFVSVTNELVVRKVGLRYVEEWEYEGDPRKDTLILRAWKRGRKGRAVIVSLSQEEREYLKEVVGAVLDG